MNDLKIIKKKYGEQMMHLCRKLFPTLLEKEGLLSSLLLNHFKESKSLYYDIVDNCIVNEFEVYINNLVYSNEDIVYQNSNMHPKDLLSMAGYDFYECNTQEDVLSFKKYFREKEMLCSFERNRLERAFVFFCVKKDVDKIKPREDAVRQDEYGTSVISIQFSKDNNHTLFITNRYNHLVNNPDATFGNNLENIIPGLTLSFEKYYGLIQRYKSDDIFAIPQYVCFGDKYYKYNYKINGKYYCSDNLVIDIDKMVKLEKEKYLLMDYYILDLVNKKIYLYDIDIIDSLLDILSNIKDIKINKVGTEKIVNITYDEDKIITFVLNKLNRIVRIDAVSLEDIPDYFLHNNEYLEIINLGSVVRIGDDFLYSNKVLRDININNVREIGNYFLYHNLELESLDIGKCVKVGYYFMLKNKKLMNIKGYSLEEIGKKFLFHNMGIEELYLPNLEVVSDYFLYRNNFLRVLSIPNVKKIGSHVLYLNTCLKELDALNVFEIGDHFLFSNFDMREIILPKTIYIGDHFMPKNVWLSKIIMDNVREVGHYFLTNNLSLEKVSIREDLKYGHYFLKNNSKCDINKVFDKEGVIKK